MAYTSIPSNPFTVPGSAAGYLDVRKKASANGGVAGPVLTVAVPGYNTTNPTPTITSFTPSSGPVGSTVVLTGTNLTGATEVSLDNAAVANFSPDSSTQVTALLTSAATTGLFRIKTPNGSAVSSAPFTVTAAAQNTTPGITPQNVPPGMRVPLGYLGDSTTALFTNASFSQSRPEQVQAQLGTTHWGPIECDPLADMHHVGFFYNEAVSGTGIFDLIDFSGNHTARFERTLAWIATQHADATVFKTHLQLAIGINNFAIGKATASQVWAHAKLVLERLKAASNKVQVAIATLTNQLYSHVVSGTDQPFVDAQVASYNDTLRAQAVGAGFLYVNEFQAIPELADYNDPAIYYDKLHPTKLGYSYQKAVEVSNLSAQYVFPALAADAVFPGFMQALGGTNSVVGNYVAAAGHTTLNSGEGGGTARGLYVHGAYPAGYDTTKPRYRVRVTLLQGTEGVYGPRVDSDSTSLSYNSAGDYPVYAMGGLSFMSYGGNWAGFTGPLISGSVSFTPGDTLAWEFGSTFIRVYLNQTLLAERPTPDHRDMRLHANIISTVGLADIQEQGAARSLAA